MSCFTFFNNSKSHFFSVLFGSPKDLIFLENALIISKLRAVVFACFRKLSYLCIVIRSKEP